MYPITEEVAKLYKEHYRQVVSITFRSTDGKTIYLTEEDIIQKGFEIDRYVVSGSKLEIGSAIAAQLTVTLNNYDEKFEDVTFEGAELCVNLGVKKWDADAWEKATIQYMPLGYFTVDETPRKTAQIVLTALDRMANFDKDADLSNLSFPCTVRDLLEYTCDHCLVSLYEDNLDDLPNITYSIPEAPDTEDITFRQIIQWIGEITGTCAYIDWNGYLRLTWFVDTDIEITKGDRYTGSDLYENDISITGVQITDLDDETYTSGTDDYCFNIEGNSLIQDDYKKIVGYLGEKLIGTTYRPFSCTTVPMPYVYPMDYITYVDKKGVSHSTLVTHTVFTLNSATTIKAVGETSTSSGYASVNPLTARERLILEKMKKSTSESIDELSEIDLERYNQLLEMNQLMANSFGLYLVEDTSGGGTVYYFADTKSLEDATVIYCFTENGFAWTTGEDCWNDGDPAWEYGFTRDGNAILNILTAYKITADQIETKTLNVSEILSNEDGEISITSNRLIISSDYFSLDSQGKITATGGEIGGLIVSDSGIASKDGSFSIKDSYTTIKMGEIGGFTLGVNTATFTNYKDAVYFSYTISTTGYFKITVGLNDNIDDITEDMTVILSCTDKANNTWTGDSTASNYYSVLCITLAAGERSTTVTWGKTPNPIGTTLAFVSCSLSSFTGYDVAHYITYNKESCNDSNSGLYLGADGIGVGSRFYVTSGGEAYLKGNLSMEYSGSTLYKLSISFDTDSTTTHYPIISSSGNLTLKASTLYLTASYLSLQNCSYVYCNNLIPRSSDTTFLGSSSYPFTEAYVRTIYAGEVQSDYFDNSSSDRRLKKDIQPLNDKFSTFFDRLKPVEFRFKADDKQFHTGFIAQEVEEALEETGINEYSLCKERKNGAKALAYDNLIALCVKEIQALKQRVADLEKQIKE